MLYNELDRYALGIQIEALGGHRLDEFGPVFAEWVAETMSAYWGWIHPRYR